MHRFFISKDNVFKDNLHIEGDDVLHITKVLRLREGDEILLCDQQGTDYSAEIESIAKNMVKARAIDKYPSRGEALIEVVLYQGLPKSTKMDLIIQKCTEMGIRKVVPVATSRAVVKLETEKDEAKKVERWSKIAEEAAKQSGRGRIPDIEMPMTFKQAVKEAQKHDICVIPYELESSTSLRTVLQGEKAASVGIFIGPEGGFDPSEIEEAVKGGIVPVTLGKRILRTETAGIAVLTCIMYEYGQLE